MSTTRDTQKSSTSLQSKTSNILAALVILGTQEAEALRQQLIAKVEETEREVSSIAHKKALFDAKRQKAKRLTRGLVQTIEGVQAMVEALAPGEVHHLPDRASLAGLDDDAYAELLSAKLIGSGHTVLMRLGKLLEETRLAKEEAVRTYARAVEQAEHVHSGRTEVAELGLLLKQAEVFILRNAKPGSPALDVFKRKPSRPAPAPAPVPAPIPVPVPAPAA